MCAVSMISGHYHEGWLNRGYIPPPAYNPHPEWTWERWNEYQELLKKAEEYDKVNNQPDCESKLKEQIDAQIAEYLKQKFGDNPKQEI